MTNDEAKAELRRHRKLGTVFVKVYAKAKPDEDTEDFLDYRFPGFLRTGYLIESPLNVIGFSDWLDIERIEKW